MGELVVVPKRLVSMTAWGQWTGCRWDGYWVLQWSSMMCQRVLKWRQESQKNNNSVPVPRPTAPRSAPAPSFSATPAPRSAPSIFGSLAPLRIFQKLPSLVRFQFLFPWSFLHCEVNLLPVCRFCLLLNIRKIRNSQTIIIAAEIHITRRLTDTTKMESGEFVWRGRSAWRI